MEPSIVKTVLEADLQRWFEDKARLQEICSYIVNPHELETIPKSERTRMRNSIRARFEALDRAQRVLDALIEAKCIVKNQSISTVETTQLRPDLILVSCSGNYVFVELKTQKASEREGVQELLAYSSASRSQMPFLSDFMFVIVARNWDPLLFHSVRSLIFDHKLVLPLKLLGDDHDSFQLSIQKELFDEIKFTEFYEPFFAMAPHTLATKLHSDEKDDDPSSRHYPNAYKISCEFEVTAKLIVQECKRINQSGFVLLWDNYSDSVGKILSLTVVTVNQFWKYSEANFSEIRPDMNITLPGMGRRALQGPEKPFNANSSQKLRQEKYSDELDDIFLLSDQYEKIAQRHPQSALSYDLIERHFTAEQEQSIRKRCKVHPFERGSHNNLHELLQVMKKIEKESDVLSISIFIPFGDVFDFILDQQPHCPLINNVQRFDSLIHAFSDWKKKQSC